MFDASRDRETPRSGTGDCGLVSDAGRVQANPTLATARPATLRGRGRDIASHAAADFAEAFHAAHDIERPELSREAIDKLLPMVSDKILLTLHERGAISPELLAKVRERFAAALRNRARRVAAVNAYIEAVRAGRLPLDEAADRLAEEERLVDFATFVSAIAHLERMHVATQDELLPVLVLLRSLDLAWTTTERFLIARRGKYRAANGPAKDLPADYEAIAGPLAQRITRFLRVHRALAQSWTGEVPQPDQRSSVSS
jgi:hypothetical protein